ncbi:MULTISPECIES: hypothetical protein [Pseudomonas]|uniref:hypothetical protein n=1 Tax=Pseudomonas TaxID=286 RepID=UPI000F01A03B|nr:MULTISPECIES: hypothetical protein [unclassified Pseudomonas]WLH47616.1 hypothetical protein PSH83_06745 [Pseudomonas sp. FP2262]WLI47399.1 hypothetical protein PSH84_11295 [Pseudomonas sp. FP830]
MKGLAIFELVGLNGIWLLALAGIFLQAVIQVAHTNMSSHNNNVFYFFPIVLFGWTAIMQNSDGTANRPFPYAGIVVATPVPEAPSWSLPLFGNNAKP